MSFAVGMLMVCYAFFFFLFIVGVIVSSVPHPGIFKSRDVLDAVFCEYYGYSLLVHRSGTINRLELFVKKRGNVTLIMAVVGIRCCCGWCIDVMQLEGKEKRNF